MYICEYIRIYIIIYIYCLRILQAGVVFFVGVFFFPGCNRSCLIQRKRRLKLGIICSKCESPSGLAGQLCLQQSYCWMISENEIQTKIIPGQSPKQFYARPIWNDISPVIAFQVITELFWMPRQAHFTKADNTREGSWCGLDG